MLTDGRIPEGRMCGKLLKGSLPDFELPNKGVSYSFEEFAQMVLTLPDPLFESYAFENAAGPPENVESGFYEVHGSRIEEAVVEFFVLFELFVQ